MYNNCKTRFRKAHFHSFSVRERDTIRRWKHRRKQKEGHIENEIETKQSQLIFIASFLLVFEENKRKDTVKRRKVRFLWNQRKYDRILHIWIYGFWNGRGAKVPTFFIAKVFSPKKWAEWNSIYANMYVNIPDGKFRTFFQYLLAHCPSIMKSLFLF